MDDEQERELILEVRLPYFGKLRHGDNLTEIVKAELELQFGAKISVERKDVFNS